MTSLAPTAVLTTLKAASTVALCALDDVKLELGISGTANDSWITTAIASQSGMIANYLRRPVAVQTYGETIWETRDHYSSRWRDRTRHAPLQLARWPLATTPSTAGTPPPPAPTLSTVAGGALTLRTYFVKTTYVTASGETAGSLEATISVPANRLLSVASPGADLNGLATGWRVYVGATSWGETQQASLAIGAAFTEPAGGLVSGAALPSSVLVVEGHPPPAMEAPISVTPLAEGVDFVADANTGQLSRLYVGGYTRPWPYFPLTVQYPAGYATTPSEIKDAAVRLVSMRYYARARDPNVKSETVPGVYSASYVAGDGRASLPADIVEMLEPYRAPLAG